MVTFAIAALDGNFAVHAKVLEAKGQPKVSIKPQNLETLNPKS